MGTKDLLIQSKRCVFFFEKCFSHLYMLIKNLNYKRVHTVQPVIIQLKRHMCWNFKRGLRS